MRLVSRRFRTIAQDRLNAGFRSLEGRLMHVQELLCNSYQHSRSDVEIQCMCKILNIMEILTLHVIAPKKNYIVTKEILFSIP